MRRTVLFPVAAACLLGGFSQAFSAGDSVTLEAEAGRLNGQRVQIVEQNTFSKGKGVSLKEGLSNHVGQPSSEPDLVCLVKTPRAGRYWIRTHASVDAKTAEEMRKASRKQASLRLTLSAGESGPTNRIVFVPWSPPDSCTQTLGKFEFNGQEQEVRIWLPEGVRLDSIQVAPYSAPKVLAAAENYQPKVVPPKSHPRLWVNQDSLPGVRSNLEKAENAPVWAQVRKLAAKPYPFAVKPGTEVGYSLALEQSAAAKAFVHLMTGDEAPGREAISLMSAYLSAVCFDNLLDVTREIGRAIYTGALVYDWCHDILKPEEKEGIRKNLMRLADDMEIGWPPFIQSIVNGHGNEAQVNRDLLSLAIAIYDEDPIPYRYCSHRILEELVPMRRFEYQSPRHNQGVSYGPYRFAWDLHAAWLFRRMTGTPVFDDQIGDVYKYWLYMRLPNGQMLRDGDGFSDGRSANLGVTPLLSYSYNKDPIVKGDLERQGGVPSEPLLFLLLNDPGLKAEKSLGSLPLTIDFGPVLGSMIARTGWNLGPNPADVVVEMKGGGYHFGNHQHADAGSFQIYYRGLQAVDLGEYTFYGTPFDSNFNKRSVAHSMLLVVDPDEKFNIPANDGGTRYVRTCPVSSEQVMKDPMFANGRVVSASFGPSKQRPFFSYFSVDLKSAYSSKIQSYTRTFCFLNLNDLQTPAALVVLDDVTSAKPEFKKYWQVNALNLPEKTADGVVLRNSALGLSGKVNVRMLRPAPGERDLEILSGEAAYDVFGKKFVPPDLSKPEAHGHRVLFSPKSARANDVFLTVMPMSDEAAPDLPVTLRESPEAFELELPGRVLVLAKAGRLLDRPFPVTVPPGSGQQLLLCGLAPGSWSIRDERGALQLNAMVRTGENTAFFAVPGGTYAIQPER